MTDAESQCQKLQQIRRSLREDIDALSPAVAACVRNADMQLRLAASYLGALEDGAEVG